MSRNNATTQTRYKIFVATITGITVEAKSTRLRLSEGY